MSLDQGACLTSKLPSGCRPNNALSRLGSPPGGWVSGRRCLYSIVKCIPTAHFETALETITITVTITVTITIIQTYMWKNYNCN